MKNCFLTLIHPKTFLICACLMFASHVICVFADSNPIKTDYSSLVFTMYNQPSAFHGDFWEKLDLKLCEKDFELLKSDGFNAIAVTIPFGSFVTSVSKDAFETNNIVIDKFSGFLQLARKYQLKTILWFTLHRLPNGISGAAVPGFIDPNGIQHESFTGYFADDVSVQFENDFRWKAYLNFFRLVARISDGFDVIFDPIDWQNLEPYPFQYGNQSILHAWQSYVRSINPDITYWAKRWAQPVQDWADILPPVSKENLDSIRKAALDTSAAIRLNVFGKMTLQRYKGHPATGWQSEEWKDFAKWRDLLLVKMSTDIVDSIRSVSPLPIGFRVDTGKRYGSSRETTWSAVNSADIIFYPVDVLPADRQQLETNASALQSIIKKPVVLWEVQIPQTEAAKMNVWHDVAGWAHRKGYGIGLWTWRDTFFNYYTDVGLGIRDAASNIKLNHQKFDFLRNLDSATVETSQQIFDTPNHKATFAMKAECDSQISESFFTVARSSTVFSLPPIVGEAFLNFKVALPSEAGDGAVVHVYIKGAHTTQKTLFEKQIMPSVPKSSCHWLKQSISLAEFKDQPTQIIFDIDAGPAADLSGDWVAWSSVEVSDQP